MSGGICIAWRFEINLKRLKKRTEYMVNGPVDVMQMTIITPLPGTRLFNRLEGEKRLLYRNYPDDWSHYDMTEVTFKPKHMKPAELLSIMEQSSSRIYSKTVMFKKFMKTFLSTRSLATALWALNSNLNYRSVALGGRRSISGGRSS